LKRLPLPFVDGSYSDDTKPFSAQDCVNYLPRQAEQAGTRSEWMLADCPGLREFSIVGDGPHRGGIVVGGICLVVSGDRLYQVFANRQSTDLGAIPGSGLVSMTFVQITNGYEVGIATGSAGYVYKTTTGVLTQITDASFPGALLFDYLNHLGLYVYPNRKKWGNSAIDDLTSYDALETYTGEASPDLIVSLKVVHGEVALFSETTTDFFANTGVVNALFQNKKIPMERGCAAVHGPVNLDNTVFWPGNDGIGYRLDSYSPMRKSTYCIEQDWAVSDLSKAFSMTWEDRGHKVWYITCPNGHTWGFDVATSKWHRRESYGLKRWRLNTLFKWNNAWYGGDFQSGMLYVLDWDYMWEGQDPHVRYRTGGVLHANQNITSVNSLEFVVDTGGPIMDSIHVVSVSPAMPDYDINTVVSHQYIASGALGVAVFSIVPPTIMDGFHQLPSGLSMNANGLVTGTTDTAGTYIFTVKATDSTGTSGYLDEEVVIAPAHTFYTTDGGSIFVAVDTLTQTVTYTSGSVLPSSSTFALCMNSTGSVVFGAGVGGKMVRIDATDYSFISASVGNNNQSVCCNASGSFAYTADTTSGDVFKRNGVTLAAVAVAVAGIGTPRAICLSRDGSVLYAVGSAGAIKRFQTSDMSALSDFAPAGQFGICINHAGTKLYASSSGADEINVVNATSGSLITAITLAPLASPRGICVSADDSTVWVANNGTGTVNRIQTSDNTIVATIACPDADQVSLSSDGLHLYVNNSTAAIQVISTVTNTLTGNIPCGIGGLMGLTATAA
jgi:hypothetical protein